MNNIKVGDVVAWDKVPDGALVKSHCERSRFRWWYLRRGEQGSTAGIRSEMDRAEGRPGSWWSWSKQTLPPTWTLWTHPERVTIVALGLTGQESARELQRLDEVFEVREALIIDALDQTVGVFLKSDNDRDLVIDHAWGVRATPDIYNGFIVNTDALLARAAERLYAAGWRPGMTAEDASRLLAETGQ